VDHVDVIFPSKSGLAEIASRALTLVRGGWGVIRWYITDLNWWIKVGLFLIALVVPILAYVIWKKVSIIWQRVKQYDFLYDELGHTASNNRQLQGNFTFFLQTLMSAGLQVFEVTGIEWGNRSPLLVIACNQQGLVGSKLVVINIFTLDTLGQFEVEQATRGGYLAREDRISNAVWWGFLREKMDRYAHPRIDDAVAVLLH
jgi:hypothetical protein